MDRQPYFGYGASILYRGVDEFGEIIDVKPVTVVEDTNERAVLWLPIGTPTMKPELLHPTSERPRRWDQGWRLVASVWQRSEALIIVQKNQLRAIWVKWSKGREFKGWDVNIQSPLRRTKLGFDIQDYQLDIVVEPNASVVEHYGDFTLSAVHLVHCHRARITNVSVFDWLSDGISIQCGADVQVTHCQVRGNSCNGFHPGSRLKRSIWSHNIGIGNNNDGLFVCGLVHDSVISDNVFSGNGSAGIAHIFNHALMKCALFMVVGCIVLRLGSSRLEDMAGIGRRMPATSFAFVLGGFALIGVPLTVGFISKWYLLLGALEQGWWPGAVLVLLSSLLAAVYIWRFVEVAYFRSPPADAPPLAAPPLSMKIPLWSLLAATLFFGVQTDLTAGIAQRAALWLLAGGP
jgi:hypothetical protein